MKKIVFNIIILIAVILPTCELSNEDESMAEIISKQKILDLVNDLRAKGCNCGGTYMPPVEKLKWDDELEKAAIAHSIDMNVEGYFSHQSLDGSSFSDRVKGTGYTGKPQGENIASGHQNEEAVFNGWKKSAGHCKNMMSGKSTDMAVGRSGNYWTMVLGRR